MIELKRITEDYSDSWKFKIGEELLDRAKRAINYLFSQLSEDN